MSKPFRFLASVLFLFFFSSAAFGQPILLYQKDGAAADDGLGGSVAGAGDVNGDGRADFIVGSPYADPGGIGGAGSSYVYSGADGTLIYQKNGTATGDWLGYSVAGAGDVNGDGRADFIIGAPSADPGGRIGAGSAFIYSGVDGSLLYQINGDTGISPGGDELGSSVSGVGDINNDGKADFIIGAPGVECGPFCNFAGAAYVYSGADGGLLYSKIGTNGIKLGYSVAGTGDVNGDGIADFIVGAPRPSGAGSAFVYSGATGTLLYTKNEIGGRFGGSVAGAGDVNGDGRSDFIIGGEYATPGGIFDAGVAALFSGATGDSLYQINGDADIERLGYAVGGAGDINGDGRDDFIVGAPFADPGGLDNPGVAFVYSGLDGSLLFQTSGAAADQVGWSVAVAGDVNGDGRADFIIGAPSASPGGRGDAGSVYVYGMPGCSAAKGDMNADAALTATDVMLMLNCVFLGTGSCTLCLADVNCSSGLTPADLVLELNAVFLAAAFPC